MATSLTTRMGALNVRSSFAASVRGSPVVSAPTPTPRCVRTSALPVVAKQNALQRQRLSEAQRMYNRSRKSAVATRMKKVFKELAAIGTPESEAALAPVEKLIAEAYQELDKAVSKGVLHERTAARRKSRLATAKREALVKAGLYTPA